MSKPSFFAIIPAHVRYAEDLSDFQKILYSEISSLSNKEGYCYASNKYFSEVFDKSQPRISEAITNLQKGGYVKVKITVGNKRKVWLTGRGTSKQAINENVSSDKRKRLYNNKTNNISLSKDKDTPSQPFNLENYLQGMEDNKQLHIQLIAHFIRRRKLSPQSAYHVQQLIQRHCKPARTLVKMCEPKVIIKTMDKMEKDYPSDIRWTLETVYKELTK